MQVHAHAAREAKQTLSPFEYQTPTLGHQDVRIEISHCGICHSDIHLIDNDWAISQYPLIPGHEIVGTVIELGLGVKHLKKGDRVGVGWQCGSCLQCEFCLRGDENLCDHSQATCVGHFGGFAEGVVVDSRFAFPIPSDLPSETTAPLLCGGITVYSPMVHYGVRPAMKVGVMGVGGLGHMALQFASAMGCEVTAFTTSSDKEVEAVKLGAHRVVMMKDADAVARAANSQDFLISTVSGAMDWMQAMSFLRPDGKLCVVGASPTQIQVPAFALISGRRSIVGSPIGSRHRIMEMLAFAARHEIGAIVEVMPLAKVNEAIAKVRANQARYRMVLKV